MNYEKLPENPSQLGGPPNGHDHEQNNDACRQIDALMAAYAIGATDPEETAFVHARLRECPDATAALAAFAALNDALLSSTRPLPPPPALEANLRRALGARPPAPAEHRRRPGAGWLAGWRWAAVWQAAAVAAILLLVGLNGLLIRQQQQLRKAYDQLAAQQTLRAEQEDAVYRLLASTGRRAFELPPAQEASAATADILWDPTLNVALLYARSFPTLPPDQAYQLWMTADGVRESGGLFSVDESGAGVLIFPVTRPLDQLDSMGITNEPAEGSPGPTGSAVVRRRFSGS
jgi:anti-sigma-K factor RskA